MKGKLIMALLFSEVILEAEDRQRKFLVSGIPTDLDDLDGWTAYEDFIKELSDKDSITVNVDSYTYGEGMSENANQYEVAYFTMRSFNDETFLSRHCKKYSHLKFVIVPIEIARRKLYNFT